MSLIIAADLMQQYKKKKQPINSIADKTIPAERTPLVSSSYINPYDALYDKYSADENFNTEAWHQSLKLGQQDNYLSFIEANKGQKMSDTFYDSQFYDYETMMLELYKPMTNDTNSEERSAEVWDAAQQAYVQESLGEMSDREYLQYQIEQSYKAKAFEIQRKLELERKDNMHWLAKTGATVGGVLAEFGEGIVTSITGILDFGVGLFAATGRGLIEGENWLDAYVDYFGDKGLTALEKRTIRANLDEWERTHTYIKDIDGNMTGVGKYMAGISNSIGMMIPAILANVVLPGAGMPLFYASIYSHNLHENANDPQRADSPSWLKIGNAFVTAGAEAVIEVALGKMLGGTLSNQLLGLSGRGIKEISKTAGVKFLFKSALQEGLEEFCQDISTELVDQFTAMIHEGYGSADFNLQTLADSFFIGALSSIFMSGGAVAANSLKGIATGGATDVYVENEAGSLEKIKGLNRLAWSSTMSDFQQAMNDLEEGKMSVSKNYELAQQVYGGLTVMTQFYKSFSNERIVAAEKLLQRVIEAEEKRGNTPLPKLPKNVTLTEKATSQLGKIQDKKITIEQKALLKVFATTLQTEFTEMVGEVGVRYKERVEKAIETIAPKLEEAGVTEIKNAALKDGTKYKKNPAMKELDDLAQGKFNDLAEGYEWAFIVDGHTAVEVDGMLFVSEAWLKNYETSDIYKFLSQAQVLDTILTDKEIGPMMEAALVHNEEFTKRKGITRERALMDLLFNPSVYQHFLLSQNAGNMFAFKDFIFRLYDVVTTLSKDQKLDKYRRNLVVKIGDKIKQTMREPTIKAIVNWNFDPQVIGADSILSKADKVFVAQHQIKKRQRVAAAQTGTISSSYLNTVDTIKEHGHFTAKELDTIDKGLKENATADERLIAVMLLDVAEYFEGNIDHYLKAEDLHNILRHFEDREAPKTQEELGELNELFDETKKQLKEAFAYKNYAFYHGELRKMSDLSKEAGTVVNGEKSSVEFTDKLNDFVAHISKVFDGMIFSAPKKPSKSMNIPHQALPGLTDSKTIQLVGDHIHSFEKDFDCNSESLYNGHGGELSKETREKIDKAKSLLGVSTDADFVTYELEKRLGNDYIVTPTFSHATTNGAVADGYKIVTKMAAEEIFDGYFFEKEAGLERDMDFIHQFAERARNDFEERNLSDFLKPDILKEVKGWTVELDPSLPSNVGGFTNPVQRKIVLNPYAGSVFETFTHEVNHALQFEYEFTKGFSPRNAFQMPDFLGHLLHNYREVCDYFYRKFASNFTLPDATTLEECVTLIKKHGRVRDALSVLGYMMVQGEIWARAYMHNGKLVKGYTSEYFSPTRSFIVSPDGKKRFLGPETPAVADKGKGTQSNLSMSINSKAPSEIYIKNVAESTFDNILGVRRDGPLGNEYIRDTVHTTLTEKNTRELTGRIISEKLPAMTRIKVNIDEIIRNPKDYLSKEMLDMVGKRGEINEGTTYHALKEWFENNEDGISIDRDGANHSYIFVDDNAFDDTLTAELNKAKQDDAHSNIVKKYTSEEGFALTNFYDKTKLAVWGDLGDIKVIANENVNTESITNKNNRKGLITIKVDSLTTNAEFIDKLNHEFRHILQYNHNFEQGFTANFNVSKKMLTDLKKNVPAIFKDKKLIALANQSGKFLSMADTFIAQRFIYYLVGGEQNAYGISSSLLNTKPVYVATEGGKTVIYMPWYDANTGEGRYETEGRANRAIDKKKKGLILPQVKRTPKSITRTIDDIGSETPVITYGYENKRYLSDKNATGNLSYFVEKGGPPIQMDPDLQNFVKGTTGHDADVHPAIMHAIYKKKLTKQSLYKFFREVDLKDVNQFTFDLINEHMFQNSYIKNVKELDTLVNIDVSFYWAASVVLANEGLAIESLLKENDIEAFVKFLNAVENSGWKEKIEKQRQKFNIYYVEGLDKHNSAVKKRTELNLDESTSEYMRVFAMQYFDGTLVGAFYVANTLRKVVRDFQNRNTETSIDATIGDGKSSLGDILVSDGLSGDLKRVGNSILARYEVEVLNRNTDDMIKELAEATRLYYMNKGKEKVESNPKLAALSAADKAEMIEKGTMKKVAQYINSLSQMTTAEVTKRYEQMRMAEMTGTLAGKDLTSLKKSTGNLRVNIVGRIKTVGTQLVNQTTKGNIVWENLPKEVQDMFELTKVTIKGKKHEIRTLKEEVWEVGRGRAKGGLPQDVSGILANLELLERTKQNAAAGVFMNKQTAKDMAKTQRHVERKVTEASRPIVNKTQKNFRETEFEVKKRHRGTSDTPNNFTIVSSIDMPKVLYKIFNISFNAMANNEVQFASQDKKGNLLDREVIGKAEFDAAVQHEVTNWDEFYEACRSELIALTRTDVLDIIEFIQKGAYTAEGPNNKLAAFQIFTLGYILDGARQGINGWNLSDAEVDMIRALYEKKAGEHGSGLNAVGQMLKVIDPLKKVRQRMLEEFDIDEAELAPLISSVENLQKRTDAQGRKEQAQVVLEELSKIEDLMIQNKALKEKKGWGKNWYAKIKSFRFVSMLSSPVTWIRNIVSNISLVGLNKSSDLIGNLIFKPKKGYRKDQWDLATAKISPEIKTFIDESILKSELFEFLYDGTTKYDERTKDVIKQKDLFVSLITSAMERKYAAEHRFDADVANKISIFVSKMISDKRFVKLAASRYLGKILTIEAAKGNVDISQGLSNQVLSFFAESVLLANTEYMRKRSFLSDMTDSLRDKHKVVYEVLTWWQPFLNSSFNWFQEALKYTPAGLVSAIYRMATLEKQIGKLDERRAKGDMVSDSRVTEYLARRDVGKGSIGLVLLGLGLMLGLTGVVKIQDDDDKFFIVAGNVKVDISNIFGTSSVLIGAALAQTGSASFDVIMRDATEVLLDGFLLKDVLDRHKWGGGMWEAMLTESESILRSFTPQLVQLIVRATNNEKIRYTPGTKGMIERWLNSFVPTQPLGHRKINPYTGEVETKYAIPFVGEMLKSGIFGPRIFWSKKSELEIWARENGVNKGELTGELTIGGVKYRVDKESVNLKYGELNAKDLAKVQKERHNVQTANGSYKVMSWSQLSTDQRARVIDRAMQHNAEVAKIYVWTQKDGHKYYASDNMWQDLKALNITRNVYRGGKGFVE